VSQEPGTAARELVQRTLDAVCGVDINPFAVAIARFRLLVAALQASGIRTLRDTPGFRINVVSGDSLLHGRRFDELPLQGESVDLRRVGGIDHVYHAEDLVELNRILGRQYHVVVGNPPYITVKDKALNQAYRNRYSTCHQKYSLGVPFTQRFFELATEGQELQSAGYVGMITTNAFMKREFGKKLIEEFLPRIDLTHIIDTSGAYIPGHGTPTVILFGRRRGPVDHRVRAVLGIRGEPSTPAEPAHGLVWRSIVEYLDNRDEQNEFVSVTDMPRQNFAKHPWSVSGGGATELREQIESQTNSTLKQHIESIGFMAITGEDDVFVAPPQLPKRNRLLHREFGIGESIRDWQFESENAVIFVYDDHDSALPVLINENTQALEKVLWAYRTSLRCRNMFGKSPEEHGFKWFEYMQFIRDRAWADLSIAFAFVATHNHFVLDRGGKVFNRSAPIIKLPSDATEDDHLALLGLLNSSTACFWMKQVFHNKGSTVDDKGARQTTVAFENFHEFTGTGLQKFPVISEKPLELSTDLDRLAHNWQKHLPLQLAAKFPLSQVMLSEHQDRATILLGQMIALQEELDWRCYT
jgi:hypothetical protein